jgi:hypothetical protein
MKKSFWGVLVLCVSNFVAFAQGTIYFNNHDSLAGVDAPIFYSGGPFSNLVKIDGTTHPTAQAALYAGPDGATEDQLALIGYAVGFRSGLAAGYVNVGSLGSRSVPGVPLGAFAMAEIRVWDSFNGTIAASYEVAAGIPGAFLGVSNLLRVKTGGDGGPGNPPSLPAPLIGLQPIFVVPEPRRLAQLSLGLACAGWLRSRMRRKVTPPLL